MRYDIGTYNCKQNEVVDGFSVIITEPLPNDAEGTEEEEKEVEEEEENKTSNSTKHAMVSAQSTVR